jgi:hypothetical protein
MHLIAQYALTACVVASALGGVVLCLLLFLYGSAPPDEEPRGAVRRRVLVTRLGHTVAAACFAATAVLALVVLSRDAGLGTTRLAEDVRALDARLSAVESGVQRIAASLEILVRRVDRDDAPAASGRPVRTAAPPSR